MKRVTLLLLLTLSFQLGSCSPTDPWDENGSTDNQDNPRPMNTRLKITAGSYVMTATLEDNLTARDFISLLPLTLTLEDYNCTEKISGLPRRLDTAGAPGGYTPRAGDIAYYAPWGNLCLFYRDFGYSASLVKIGSIAGDISALGTFGTLENVKIEAATDR